MEIGNSNDHKHSLTAANQHATNNGVRITTAKHSNVKLSEKLERSVKVSNIEQQQLNQIVGEITFEASGSKKFTKSCNLQDQLIYQNLSNEEVKSEIEDTNIEEIAMKETFDLLDVTHVSDFWDQETYLSEHNYDEALDVETAKNILNFGDDYRNFIESNSEVKSPRFLELAKKKRSIRNRLENERGKLIDDSNSEEDLADTFKVIYDLKKDIVVHEDDYKHWRSKCFETSEKAGKIESLLLKCEGSCKFLNNLQVETTGSNNFVARKRSREIRLLQNSWKRLEKLARKDQKLKSVYRKIKEDIQTMTENLAKHQKLVKVHERKRVSDLRKYVRFYKDSNIKLMGFKSRLFELNLAVHTLLADVSNNTEDEVKYLEVDRMRDDVVELYDIWDKCMREVSSRLVKGEESFKSVNKIEKDLSELSDFLMKETNILAEKSNSKHLTIDDSGISDESGDALKNVDIIAREEHLKSLKVCVLKISNTLSPNASVIININSVLKESGRQLKILKSYAANIKEATSMVSQVLKKNEKPFVANNIDMFWQRVKKFAVFFIILFAILLLLLVVITPSCCELRNTMLLFYPRLSYVNGPPPI